MADDKSQSEKDETNKSSLDAPIDHRTEYFNKLERWLLEAYAWYSFIAICPYLTATSQIVQGATPVSTSHIGATLASSSINNNNQQRNDEGLRQRRATERIDEPAPAPVPAPVPAQAQAQAQEPVVTGITYRIPPVWKRFVAEFIDSMLLFVLKLSITYIAVDIFDFIDVERYYLDMLQTNLRIDYKMALELTSGILILELIHKVFVCLFEAAWLQHGRNGRIGGATPGKSLMHLKVILCQNVTPVGRPEEELVLVVPGTDLGLFPALGRSVLKNLILAFFFPICFALCFFRFNRTGYDLICNSIVVEDSYRNGNNNINNNDNNNNFNNHNINNERVRQQ